jgi:hypothetical protein
MYSQTYEDGQSYEIAVVVYATLGDIHCLNTGDTTVNTFRST